MNGPMFGAMNGGAQDSTSAEAQAIAAAKSVRTAQMRVKAWNWLGCKPSICLY